MAMTMATIQSDGRKIAASAMASSRAGKAIIRSVRAHDDCASPAAPIPGEDAERRAGHDRDAVRRDANDERGARPIDQPGKQVAPEQVCAEQKRAVGCERPAKLADPVSKLLVGRIRGQAAARTWRLTRLPQG